MGDKRSIVRILEQLGLRARYKLGWRAYTVATEARLPLASWKPYNGNRLVRMDAFSTLLWRIALFRLLSVDHGFHMHINFIMLTEEALADKRQTATSIAGDVAT